MVEKMKTLFRTIVLGSLLTLSANSYALSESEAEDMADLTAVFVFLKNDCGYQNLPNTQIRRALVFFAQQNQWDLSNYDSFNMKALGEDSYRDLSGIQIPTTKKCKALARDSLSLLAYVKSPPPPSFHNTVAVRIRLWRRVIIAIQLTTALNLYLNS